MAEVRQALLSRLDEGFVRPGERFLSARDVSSRFHISYQTAHRLLAELCHEGRLQRRAGAGTYVPGPPAPAAAMLCFHPRSQRVGSFGHKLLGLLQSGLRAEGVPYVLDFAHDRPAHKQDATWRKDASDAASERSPWRAALPVIWESPAAVARCLATRQPAVLLNDRPPAGMASLFIDSVSVDDTAGGVYAAQLLLARSAAASGFAVVAGPVADRRSQQRVAGFRAILPRAHVVQAGGWFAEHAQRVARTALARGKHGIFCCNDRLAEGLVLAAGKLATSNSARPLPPIVGFDDAPIAETLNLSTIAIPWSELVRSTVHLIRRRLAGDTHAAGRLVLNPHPVSRG